MVPQEHRVAKTATDYSFRTVHASVRPARIAVFTDRNDSDWQHTAVRIIEFYSQVWGGAQGLIVPTDGKTIVEPFWHILEAYDPDYLLGYRKSLADLKASDSSKYSQIIEANLKQAAQPGFDAEPIRAHIEETLLGAPLSQFEVEESLQQELKRRLAPFFFEGWTVDARYLSADSSPSFPLTDIAEILGTAAHPDRVSRFDCSDAGLPALWIMARTGSVTAKFQKRLESSGVGIEEEKLDSNRVGDALNLGLGLRQSWAAGSDAPGAATTSAVSPFALTMLELGLYRPLEYQYWKEPLVLVAGESVEDFALYYCLSRLRDRVEWIPPRITEVALAAGDEKFPVGSAEFYFASKISQEVRFGESKGGAVCISHSLNAEQKGLVISRMMKARILPVHIEATGWEPSLVRHPLSANERENFEHDIIVQLMGEITIAPFRTPKPKHFDLTRPYEHRWITQLTIPKEQAPRHPEIGTWIVSHRALTTHEARVGRYGPAYFCPNIAYFGGDIDTILTRPNLRFPSLDSLLRTVCAQAGYEIRPSDKGIYADESIEKWNGIEASAAFFADPQKAALLQKFLDRAKSSPGHGVFLTSDRRRYLDFAAIHAIMAEGAERTIDDLIARGILHRGFIFLCTYCRSADWFSVGEVTQEFTCKRCGRSQIFSKENWKQPSEPSWFYKLDEIVYQGCQNNMGVGLLAIDRLRRRSKLNFMFTTDRELWRSGGEKPEMEADFVCVSDGRLAVGEAKRENVLGQSASDENAVIHKYVRLSAVLTAREVVFATTSNEWNPRTRERITTQFGSQPSTTITLLTSHELV